MVRINFKAIAAAVSASLILAIAPGAALAMPGGNDNPHLNITICHATGSTTNPYVVISPNANGVVSGHYDHQDARDIIPPFDYNDHGTTMHFPGQNWDSAGQAIFNNGCVVPQGGQGGGPQKDCDGDYDNSPAADCTVPQPQKDCDGDYDHSPVSECIAQHPQKDCDGDYDNSADHECTAPQPQKDCDGDFDNSASTDCTTQTGGGMGGGPTSGTTTPPATTTTSGTPQVLGASTAVTAGGLGAGPQVAAVPQGSVNGGHGAASKAFSRVSVIGLFGSLLSVGTGLALLNRRQS